MWAAGRQCCGMVPHGNYRKRVVRLVIKRGRGESREEGRGRGEKGRDGKENGKEENRGKRQRRKRREWRERERQN